jgi:H+/Cl- antiporter ClcA
MVGMKKQQMPYLVQEVRFWVRVLIPALIFCGIQIALNHSSDPRIQHFMTKYWFPRHWYSGEVLYFLLLYVAAIVIGRRLRRSMVSRES